VYGIFLFLFNAPNIFWAQEKDWELVKEKNGIKIFSWDNPQTGLKEIRIQFKAHTEIDHAIAYLRDPSTYPDWIYKCTEAHSIKQKTNGIRVYYSRLDFPWPLKDRDIVARSEVVRNPENGAVVVRAEALEGNFPEKDKVIRISYMHSKWTFTPLKNDMVLLEYQLQSDPGGALPKWAINLAATKGPYKTAKKFKKHISQNQ